MFLKNIELYDYRGIKHLSIDFKAGANLLVGVNGTGKSSILDALAIMLSSFVRRIEGNESKSRKFIESDIANDKLALMVSVGLHYNDQLIKWSIARKSSKKRYKPVADNTYYSDFKKLNLFVNHIVENVTTEINNDYVLPIAVYYDVHRAVIEPPMRVKNTNDTWILDVYEQALDQKSGADFKGFFKWFRTLEDIENEKIRDDGNYRDKQLNTVRKAIESFIPEFKKLRIRRSPLRMTVEKNGKEFNIKQLSDGEKCLLAMVGDIARRLAMANPKSENSLNGKGIILIDEIDLHLHPSWQRMVVERLITTFPNCQFILSTHSPQIISHVKPDSIWLLNNMDNDIDAIQPSFSFGLDSNLILESVMGVPERENSIKTKLKQLFNYIAEGDYEMAEKLLSISKMSRVISLN